MTKILPLLFVLFLAITAHADEKIVGHIIPLQSEMLSNPIELKCGAIIVEWRGSTINKHKANKICTFTKSNFFPFIKSKGYETIENIPFHYYISFIPVDSRYRNLNDKTYRFKRRGGSNGEISGYTSLSNRYLFNLSNMNDSEFEVSFVHELFHAMSHHYGVYMQHPGKSINKKLSYDEMMAQEFTMKIMGKK